MTNEAKNFKLDELGIAILIIPVLVLPIFAEDIKGNIPEVVMSMILALIGGFVGMLFFWLTQNQIKTIRISALIVLILGTFTGMYHYSTNRDEDLLTCKICGYHTLEEMGEECAICWAEFNDDFLEENEYSSYEEMIIKEQIVFFSDELFTFDTPKSFKYKNTRRFKKDRSWKPSIDEKALKNKE